jgi:adenosylhomocysteine nucleosidase
MAGALVPEMTVGHVLIPATVVNSRTGTMIRTGHGKGTLVTASGIAGPEGKRLFARQYSGLAVDMEAAAVAEVAKVHKLGFSAVKAISDDVEFPVPDLEPFVDRNGKFLTSKFLAHIAPRPRLWGIVRQFAANSAQASQELCRVLRNLIETGKWQTGPKAVRPAANDEGIRVP